MFTFVLLCSLEEIYGRVFSLKLGSHKCVIASTPEAVKEILVKKSADYAGRPKAYSIDKGTLGKVMLCNCTVTFLLKAQFLVLQKVRCRQTNVNLLMSLNATKRMSLESAYNKYNQMAKHCSQGSIAE